MIVFTVLHRVPKRIIKLGYNNPQGEARDASMRGEASEFQLLHRLPIVPSYLSFSFTVDKRPS